MNIIQQLREEQARLVAEGRALLDKAAAEKRDLNEDEDKRYNEIIAAVDRLDARIQRETEMQRRELQLEQPTTQAVKPQADSRDNGAPSINVKTKRGDSEEKALAYYIRTGDAGALSQELREQRAANDTTMNITTAADGGNAVPTGHYNQIIARRDEVMLAPRLGVRDIPGVGTTVNVPVDNEDDGEFATTAEQSDAHDQNFERDAPAIGTVAMTLVKKSKKIELTDELLQDEDSNLLSFVGDFVGRGMAKTHNSMLLTEVLANGTAALTLDSATDVGATEVPELFYKLPDEYADDGTTAWVVRRATEGLIRGKQGNPFLYDPTPMGGTVARSLWTAPLYNSAYAGAVQASGKSLVFANWYFVGKREAPTITFLRDPYTVDGMVILKYYFRAVYKVLQAEAVLYATHPTA